MAPKPDSPSPLPFSKRVKGSRFRQVHRADRNWRTFLAHPLVEQVDSRRHQRVRTACNFISGGDAAMIVNDARVDSFQTRLVNLSRKYMDLEIHLVAKHIELASGCRECEAQSYLLDKPFALGDKFDPLD